MGRTYRKNIKKNDSGAVEKLKNKPKRKQRSHELRVEDEDAIIDSIELSEEIDSEMKYQFDLDPEPFLEPSDLINYRLVGSLSLVDGDGFLIEDSVLVDFWVDNEEMAEKVMENVMSITGMRR